MSDEPEVLPETEMQTPAIREPQPATSDDPAATAFEELRKEVALVRRAVSGLAAERATVPDYSETLGQILQACSAAARRFKELKELPALHLTPESIGRQIDDAAETARRANHAALTEAGAALQQTTRDLNSHMLSARSAKSQRIWLAATGAVCLVTGMILWAIIAGYADRPPPADLRSPEAKAAAIKRDHRKVVLRKWANRECNASNADICPQRTPLRASSESCTGSSCDVSGA